MIAATPAHLPKVQRLVQEAAHGWRRGRSLARLGCVLSNGKLRRYYEAAGYHQIRETDFGGRADIPRCGLYEKAL